MSSSVSNETEKPSPEQALPNPSRRAVLGGTGVVLVAAATGFVLADRATSEKEAPASPAPTDPEASPERRELTPLDQVPAGGGVVLADAKVVVTRDAEGQVHGFSAVCTHQGCLVSRVAEGTIDCACHGSKFDLRTGAPVAGPASRPLPTVAVKVVANTVVAG